MRKGDEDWVKKCMEYRVEGRRPVGRPRKTWLESVETDTGYKTDHRAVLAFTDQCTSGGTGPYRSALVRIY